MLTKKMFAALAAAAAIAAASASACAASAPIPLEAAAAAAQKAYPGEAIRSTLVSTPNGPVWEVCVEQQTGARVHVIVDAETGKVVSADMRGIAPRAGMGAGPVANGYPCPYVQDGYGQGYGQGYGRGGHHRGAGMHHGW